MRVVDKNGKTLKTFDLAKGFLVDTFVIKETADPIDNKTKFAWCEDDWEKVQMYIEKVEESGNNEFLEMKENISKIMNTLNSMKSSMDAIMKINNFKREDNNGK